MHLKRLWDTKAYLFRGKKEGRLSHKVRNEHVESPRKCSNYVTIYLGTQHRRLPLVATCG